MGTGSYRERHPFCEVFDCMNRMVQVHHIRSKGAGGSNDDVNLVTLCGEHHAKIHSLGWRTFVRLHPETRPRIEAAHEVPR